MTALAPLRVLIVDDEPPARRRLRRMIEGIEGVAVAGEAADGPSALAAVSRLAPDVVLLDIRMPGLDGLAVARDLPERPAVIFTTAHPDFAVEAFDTEAADYLLKPVDPRRLARALGRARRRVGQRHLADTLSDLTARLNPPDLPRLQARRGDTVYYFDPHQVACLRAADKYVEFEHAGQRYSTDDSLAALERRLSPAGFARAHRAALVRVDAVRALRTLPAGGAVAELDDGQEVRVSRRCLPELRRALSRRQAPPT